ncbi:MAG: hypothetical protein IJW55_03295 [Clostridia bacterium]|nr:hypothetical protein [Clostridia bacterium]
MSNWEKRYGVKPAKEEKTTKGKTETFFSRNVRLITFLITLGVFLAAFLPIAYLEAREYFGQDADTRPKMTTYDLIILSEQPEIKMSQLTKFACEESRQEGQNFSLIQLYIEPNYIVMASADTATGMVVYCKMLNNETNEEIDVLEDDVRAYFGN